MSSLEEESNTDRSHSMGKKMMVIAWIFAIILLTFLFGLWEEKQLYPNSSPNSSRSDSSIEVKLKRNRYGHYLVSGSVNREEALFLLDTGATLVAVPGELQQKYNLVRGRSHYSNTANGTTKAYATIIETLTIGDIHLTNVKASIIPNMKGDEILLGMSALKQLEFTQKGNQLTLRQMR